MLHEFIAVNGDEIIRRCRAKVAARSVPPPTEAELDHGVPVFLDQLRNALRFGQTTSQRSAGARSGMVMTSCDRVYGVAGRARLWRHLPGHHRTGRRTERADQHHRLSDAEPLSGRCHRRAR